MTDHASCLNLNLVKPLLFYYLNKVQYIVPVGQYPDDARKEKRLLCAQNCTNDFMLRMCHDHVKTTYKCP